MDDAGEDITYQQLPKAYFDETADQTLCVKFKITASLDNYVTIVSFADAEDDDFVDVDINDADISDMIGRYYTESGDAAAGGNVIDLNTWEVIGYSWQGTQVGSNGDHSSNAGGSATWGDGWEDDTDELDWAMTESSINLAIGSVVGDPGDTEIIYIDEWAIVGSYKFDCSTLFSPE